MPLETGFDTHTHTHTLQQSNIKRTLQISDQIKAKVDIGIEEPPKGLRNFKAISRHLAPFSRSFVTSDLLHLETRSAQTDPGVLLPATQAPPGKPEVPPKGMGEKCDPLPEEEAGAWSTGPVEACLRRSWFGRDTLMVMGRFKDV